MSGNENKVRNATVFNKSFYACSLINHLTPINIFMSSLSGENQLSNKAGPVIRKYWNNRISLEYTGRSVSNFLLRHALVNN